LKLGGNWPSRTALSVVRRAADLLDFSTASAEHGGGPPTQKLIRKQQKVCANLLMVALKLIRLRPSALSPPASARLA